LLAQNFLKKKSSLSMRQSKKILGCGTSPLFIKQQEQGFNNLGFTKISRIVCSPEQADCATLIPNLVSRLIL
jgi:hypothetical protein